MPTQTTIIQEARIASAPMVNNLLVNPGFEIWQRGVGTFNSTTSPIIYTADEWGIGTTLGSGGMVDRDTSALFGNYCAKMSIPVSGSGLYLQQGVESYKGLEGKWVTFSVWIKSQHEGIHVYILDSINVGGAEASGSSPYSTPGEWQQLTVTRQIRTGLVSGTPGMCHGYGVSVSISPYNVPTGTEVFVDGAALVEGYYPEGVSYAPLNPAEDQERCQRFYQHGDVSLEYGNTAIYSRYVVTGSQYWANLWFPTSMQAVPTVTLVNGSNAGFSTAVGTVQAGLKGFKEYRTCNLTSNAGFFYSYWTAEIT